jgi:membrane protein YdbS with pleckstrin-like domain
MECLAFAFAILLIAYTMVALLFIIHFKIYYNSYLERFEEDILLNEWDEGDFTEAMIVMMVLWPVNLESLCG